MRRQIVQTTAILIAGVLIGAILFGGNAKPVIESTSATSSVAAVETATVATSTASASAVTPLYPVGRVVDGDTLVVEMNGKSVKIRLIGLDTPETVDPRKPVQCFGIEASNKAKEMFTGKRVRIETDSSQGEYDKYGRLLAYVYLPDLPDSAGKAGGTLFNEYMIAEGYGHEYTYNLPYKYQSEFKAAEAQARAEKKGLWADGVCGANMK